MSISTVFNSVLFFGAMLLLTTPILASTQNTGQPWQDPVYIQKAFNEIALKNEYRATEGRILKWQAPIRYQKSVN